jgi:hypothetical protein
MTWTPRTPGVGQGITQRACGWDGGTDSLDTGDERHCDVHAGGSQAGASR